MRAFASACQLAPTRLDAKIRNCLMGQGRKFFSSWDSCLMISHGTLKQEAQPAVAWASSFVTEAMKDCCSLLTAPPITEETIPPHIFPNREAFIKPT